jgi:hypothetical protein
MNIPAQDFKVKVGEFWIDVIYKETSKVSGRANFGHYNHINLRIVISRKYNKNQQQLENTLIHEIFHAIWEIFGVHDVSGYASDESAEETFVSRLTSGWQSFMVDNPQLFNEEKK